MHLLLQSAHGFARLTIALVTPNYLLIESIDVCHSCCLLVRRRDRFDRFFPGSVCLIKGYKLGFSVPAANSPVVLAMVSIVRLHVA